MKCVTFVEPNEEMLWMWTKYAKELNLKKVECGWSHQSRYYVTALATKKTQVVANDQNPTSLYIQTVT